MLTDPDHLIFGGTPLDRSTIQWTDTQFGTDPANINKADLNINWTLRPTADQWIIRAGDEDDSRVLTLDPTGSILHGDFRVTGTLTDLDLGDDTIRLSEFDTNGELELRHSSSDSDQIAFVTRHGTNDYQLDLLVSGNREQVLTTAADNLDASTLEGASRSAFLEENPTVSNNGSVVDSNPPELDFGDDLGVSNTNAGVTIDFIGSQIPSEVYDNGTLVVSESNGIDFLDSFIVQEDTDNGRAQIVFDGPDDLASTTADETVTGTWTFDTTAQGSIAHAIDADSASSAADADAIGGTPAADIPATNAAETITGTWTFDTVAQGTVANAETADSATTADSAGYADEAGNASTADSAADADSVGGVAVTGLAELASAETITANWTYDNTLGIAGENELRFGDGNIRQRWSSTNSHLVVEDYADGTSTPVMEVSASGIEMPQGGSVGGSSVLTRADESSLSVDHASTADSATSADSATEADHATTADSLTNTGEIAETDVNETITGTWAFTEFATERIEVDSTTGNMTVKDGDYQIAVFDSAEIDFNSPVDIPFDGLTTGEGVTMNGGTLDLPVHNGSDPGGRRDGSMWFREDLQ